MAEKVGQQVQVLYYKWPAFLAQEQKSCRRTSKFVDAAASVVGTESSVGAVFPGSRTEDDTFKVVEAAASVVTVSMLTFGVSVVDADESTL